MDNSVNKLFTPSECLNSLCLFQSNLLQIVNEYLQQVLHSDGILPETMYSILESLSLILPVVPSLIHPVSVFLSSISNPFEQWLSSSDLKPWTTLYHLLPHILSAIRTKWNWESLFSFVSCENMKVRYYACQIICILLNKTEKERNQMEMMLQVDLSSCYQSQVLMDVLKEEECFRNLMIEHRRNFLHRTVEQTSSEEMEIESSSSVESQEYVEICGYILPCKSSTSSTTSSTDDFVMTSTSKENLSKLCLQMQKSAPILLQGSSGSGKTHLFQELARLTHNTDYVQLFLDDQMDSKSLIGNYVCTDKPGEFIFQPGTLTQCITSGKWIIIEDIDKIPFDIVTTLLPIIEKGELSIPSRGVTISVHPNFRLFGTSSHEGNNNPGPISSFLNNHWNVVNVNDLSMNDLKEILQQHYSSLIPLIQQKVLVMYQVLIKTSHITNEEYEEILDLLQSQSVTAVTLSFNDLMIMHNEILRHGKPITCRDLFKFCKRLTLYPLLTSITNNSLSEQSRKLILDEALDVFAGSLPAGKGYQVLSHLIAVVWNLSTAAVDSYLQTAPAFSIENGKFEVGRIQLELAKEGERNRRFFQTKQSLQLMQQICACVRNEEPMLLVGETGCGKTTVIQYITQCTGQELVVLNMNEQTQCSDLIGGFKPVDLRQLAIPLYNRCCTLFNSLFMDNKHPTFKPGLKDAIDTANYKKLVARFKNFCSFASSKIQKAFDQNKQSGRSTEKYEKWLTIIQSFYSDVLHFEKKVLQVENSFAFSFIPGALVDALEKGKWILLDELNLAPGEVLQRLSGLLESTQSSLILSERGDVTPIKRHPNFRIFAAMNPATDVGKKSLAPAIRNRFSEFYVNELTDQSDLELIVRSSLSLASTNDLSVTPNIVHFYLEARKKAETSLVDGANKAPHYSLRTLCRALDFVNNAGVMKLTFKSALFEGLCMAFLTMLDIPSQAIMKKMIIDLVFYGKELSSLYPSRNPGGSNSMKDDYVLVNRYWIRKGESECIDLSKSQNGKPPQFILTNSVKNRLDDLCRAILLEKCPVLLQGPTSSGKTSMIMFLAALTGHKCVRINNHEYTDLQDYTGIYISSPTGQLVFHEGLLVEALRNGYWVILDELNLAPSEVLEALNRLLDDNRELYIPETNTIVKPHPNFMLFATQNPPGKYGGRKVLSRAFRNRFLEMHVEDLPPEELQIIIQQRSGVCERFAKEMIQVMQKLQLERQNSNVFAGKDGFITPRDLLRWGNRCPASSEELAYHGYMLLAERLRREDERMKVKNVLEEVCKVKLDLNAFYLEDEIIDRMMDPTASVFNKEVKEHPLQLWSIKTLYMLQQQIQEEYRNGNGSIPSGLKTIAIVGTLKKLFKLIGLCLYYNEPVLLVGGTGCGKTTAVQLVAQALHQHLVILNCHAHTETADIIGGQRPSRTHEADSIAFKQKLLQFISLLQQPIPFPEDSSIASQDYREFIIKESPGYLMNWIHGVLDEYTEKGSDEIKQLIQEIRTLYGKYQTIFTWQDGPLLSTMKNGDIFLLDEISLAEDAVLERMNSILETERQITIPEKGGDCIEVYTANEKFRILATMNPGGDFGKKELSAALRNRFTEIWVSPLDGLDDLKEIMKDRIAMKERGTSQFPALSEEQHQALISILNPYIELILSFINYYNTLLNQNTTSSQNRTEATSRDILSIIDFMKIAVSHLHMSPAIAFAESLHMILFDGLGIGTNMSSALCSEYKSKCFSYLLELVPEVSRNEVISFYSSSSSISFTETSFGISPYTISIRDSSSSLAQLTDYHFNAPTTSNNLKRVLRALQLRKPILLEGSPGVGKTSLIMAIAQVIGQKIVRINLSEQTDMADLLGSDLPVPLSQQKEDEKGNSLQFQWSDGILLSGIKQGAWILLDELNLASQQVLEGLNSCLDHRATVYIPEIDKEFHCPETFQIFACQNPIEEGGGRKGLPRSFINRFARVYVDALKEDDMVLISKQLVHSKLHQYYGEHNSLIQFKQLDTLLERMVQFIIRLDSVQNVGRVKNIHSFEFNLRDIFRWCDLMFANQVINEWNPAPFVEMLFIQRMRDSQQRANVIQLYQDVFSSSFTLSFYPSFYITDHIIQIGNAIGHRINSSQSSIQQPLLRQSLPYLQSLLFAVQNKLPCLLIGESGSGKSYALHSLASLLNVRLYEYNMNTTTDATEILGCFEQVEVSRHYSRLLSELVEVLQSFLWKSIISNCEATMNENCSSKRLRMNSIGDQQVIKEEQSVDHSSSPERRGKRSYEVTPRACAVLQKEQLACLYTLLNTIEKSIAYLNSDNQNDFGDEILKLVNHCDEILTGILSVMDEEIVEETKVLLQPAFEILQSIKAIHNMSNHVSFEWIDGSLIEAIIRGYWVVFDNVNFCNASVLDRLNSLLENNGFLLINECGLVDGKERILYPHNNFRIFFVMNPSFGEISRAMRNRCVEIYFTPIQQVSMIDNQDINNSTSLFDEIDIVNEFNVNDFFLQLLLIQLYHSICSIYHTNSLMKLNNRHLKRFVALIIEELERSTSLEDAISLSIHNIFNQPFLSSFTESSEYLIALQQYHQAITFCKKYSIPYQMTLPSSLSMLNEIGNNALSIQELRELYLLNLIIQFSSSSSLTNEVIQEWSSLLLHQQNETPGSSIQTELSSYFTFFMNHSTSSNYQFYLMIIMVYLMNTHSKPNIKRLEIFLSPKSSSTKLFLSLFAITFSILQKSSFYQEYKSIQNQLLQAVHEMEAKVHSSHIPLFSNNLDESIFCSLQELFSQLPLFVSLQDPLLQKIHKIVLNQSYLCQSDYCITLLDQLSNTIEQMNQFLFYLPFMSFLSYYSSSVIQKLAGNSLSPVYLASCSVLELSLLIYHEQMDPHQLPNPLIQSFAPLLTNLIEMILQFIQTHYDLHEILFYSQYLIQFIHFLYQQSYQSLQDQGITEQFNMKLISFIQLFHSFFISYHATIHDSTLSVYEEGYNTAVTSILQSLHIQSNIMMDNKLWNLLGKQLMCLPSDSFTYYMEILGSFIANHFTFSNPIEMSNLSTDYQFPALYFKEEEKEVFVEALATLFWMSKEKYQQQVEGSVSFEQLKEVIEQTIKNCKDRVTSTQEVVDTTFNGSVEIEDAASQVIMLNTSASLHYETLIHDVVCYFHSLSTQSSLLQALFSNQWNSSIKQQYKQLCNCITIPVEQLVMVKQIFWLSEKGIQTHQSIEPYLFEFLRGYLENYWSDFCFGYHLFDLSSNIIQSEEMRVELKGSNNALIPIQSYNLQGLLKPLLQNGGHMKNNRNHIEQLSQFKSLIQQLFNELNTNYHSVHTTKDILHNEVIILYQIVSHLLSCILEEHPLQTIQWNELTQEVILFIQQAIQTQLSQSTDSTSMRFETLCLQFLPSILQLFITIRNTTSSLLITMVISTNWILVGLLLFYMILPSSIIDPLFNDYVNSMLLNEMNVNMNDLLFLLQYQSLLLNGSLNHCDNTLLHQYQSLYQEVLQRNQQHLQLLDGFEFKRQASNSFDQLYFLLYSFGSSILNMNRIQHLHSSFLSILENIMKENIIILTEEERISFTQIQSIIQSFYTSITTSSFILVDSNSSYSTSSLEMLCKEEEVFQSNLLSFKQSLQRSYAGYLDIINPVLCSISSIQQGIHYLNTIVKSFSMDQINLLINQSFLNSSLYYQALLPFSSFPLPILQCSSNTLYSNMIDLMNHPMIIQSSSKSLIFQSLLTQLLLFNLTVLQRNPHDSSIPQFIRNFTDMYNQQKEDEAKKRAEEEKAVEFRTRKVDIDNISSNEEAIEAAYKEQFPDYQLLFDEEAQAQAQAQAVDVAFDVDAMKRQIEGDDKVLSQEWKINSTEVEYVYEIIQLLMNQSVKSNSIPMIRDQIVYLNSQVLNTFEKEIHSLVLTDYQQMNNLLLLLQMQLTKEVTEGCDLSSLLHPSRHYSFHHHSNIAEAEYCLTILIPMRRRVFSLLQLYPTHVVLQYIIRLIDHILQLPITTPLNVLLSGVEVLSRRVHDWEISAAQHVSLNDYVKQLNGLIIRWRKLELESWGSFLEEEDEKFAKKSLEYFCQLYSLLLPSNSTDTIAISHSIQNLTSLQNQLNIHTADLWTLLTSKSIIVTQHHLQIKEEDDDTIKHWKMGELLEPTIIDSTHTLIDILDSYLRGSQLLEFYPRLQLLLLLSRFMKHQLTQNNPHNSVLEVNMNILYHTTRMYSVFIPAVLEYIESIKSPIEKQLKDQVKLGKWDDQSYFSLRETVHKIHHQLFKLIYQYRESNLIKVNVVLDKYLNNELQKEETEEQEHLSMEYSLFQFKETPLIEFSQYEQTFTSLVKKQEELTISNQLVEVALLNHLSVIYTRMNQIFSSSSIPYLLGLQTPGVDMDNFAVTIITTALELKKETKYTIRKQKAFSSLLTHLKENGISSLKATVSPYQQQYDYVMRLSIPELKAIVPIMKEMTVLNKANQMNQSTFITNWSKADQYFYKNYLLLNSLRLQISQEVTDQLTSTDIHRCIGFTENLMTCILQQREVITSLASSIQQLYTCQAYYSSLLSADELTSYSLFFDMPTISQEIEECFTATIEVIDEVLFVIQKVQDKLSIPTTLPDFLTEMKKTLQLELSSLLPNEVNDAFKLYSIIHTSSYLNALSKLQEVLSQLIHETEVITDNTPFAKRLVPAQQQWSYQLTKVTQIHQQIITGCMTLSLSQSSTSSESVSSLLLQHNQLVNQLLLILQKVKHQCDENQEKWKEEETVAYQTTHNLLLSSWNILSLGTVHSNLLLFIQSILQMNHDSFLVGVFLLKSLMPLIKQILCTTLDLLLRSVMVNKGMNKLEYVLLKLFKEILKKGFCLPPKKEEKKEKEQEGMEEGTGMGDGEGQDDVTDQLDNKDQLDGIRSNQEEKMDEEQEEEQEKEAEDTGMDVDDDFEGEERDVKKEEEDENEEEEEEKDLDREMGDLDQDDQEVVDEKLWNEDEEEEKPNENEKIEQDQKQENKKNTDEMTTKEDDKTKEQQEQQEQEQQEEQQEEQQQQPEVEEMEEEQEMVNDLNEQEYEDDHFMNQEEEQEEEFPDEMSIEDDGQEEEINEENENEIPEEEEEGEDAVEEEEEEEMNEDAESEEMNGLGQDDEEDMNNEEDEELDVDNSNDNLDEEKETKENEEKMEKENKTAPTEGIADETGEDNVLDDKKEEKAGAAEEQEEEEKEEEDEKQQNAPDEGNLQEGSKEQENEEKKEEEDKDEVNPYKNPEKTLKKWEQQYQRLQMIPQKEEEQSKEETQEQSTEQQEPQPLQNDVKQEKSGQDVLAPSLQDVDFKPQTEEANRVEMEEEEEENDEDDEENAPDEERYQKDMKEDIESSPFPEEEEIEDEIEEKKKKETEASTFASDLLERVTKEGASNESVDKDEIQGVLTAKDIQEKKEEEKIIVPFADEDSYMNLDVSELIAATTTDSNRLTTAMNTWKEFVSQTTDLSNRLTEQLRLLLEPTKASKLTGDFKTGKRINMRKVIPFIASNYRKDKIWLRRSKPSQREYQVMLVIDDSQSMKQNNADAITFKTLAMIGTSLSQLEIGQIGVMSFGDSVQYIHQLGTPFTSQSGSTALTHFTFAQQHTNFEECLKALIAILVQSRLRLSGAAKRAVQIAFIVSDGRIQEGRDHIAKLIRDAEENNILIVLLIIDDTKNPDDSILKTKIYTGKKGKLFANYLENYPFPYYLVIRSVQSLPEVLSDALTQWFEMINSKST